MLCDTGQALSQGQVVGDFNKVRAALEKAYGYKEQRNNGDR
jgi:hypothetical protein